MKNYTRALIIPAAFVIAAALTLANFRAHADSEGFQRLETGIETTRSSAVLSSG